VQILTRWLVARAAIIAELEGSDPGHLWIPTKPGRPRGGRPPVKPGLTRAAVRTLHAAHRTLVSQMIGTPLRPGALRESARGRETDPATNVAGVRGPAPAGGQEHDKPLSRTDAWRLSPRTAPLVHRTLTGDTLPLP
jgi:hypothetical protein